MSRSRKKPFYKDKGWRKREYWKVIRREWKQDLKTNWDNPDFSLRQPREIIDDYDYCDYWFHVVPEPEKSRGYWWSNYGWTPEDVKKYSRK